PRPELRRKADVHVPRQGDTFRQVQPIYRIVRVQDEQLTGGRRARVEAAVVGAADAHLPVRRAPDEARFEAGADGRKQLMVGDAGRAVFRDRQAGGAHAGAEQKLTVGKGVGQLQVADGDLRDQAVALRVERRVDTAEQRVLLMPDGNVTPSPKS